MISIIVPVYNTSEYLDKCLQSLVSQSYKDIEIILIDDHSTDHSADIMRQWERKDRRIRTIYKTENTGVSDSRNSGLSIAKGDFIGFADSDDLLGSDMYLFMMQALAENNADIAVCSITKVYPDKTVDLPVPETRSCVSREKALSVCMKHIDKGENNMFVWNKLFRRSIFDSIPKFRTQLRYCEDVLWVTEAFCKAERFVFCSSVSYYYRQMREASSMDLLKKGITDPINAYESVYRELIRHKSGCADIAFQRMLNYKNTLFMSAARQGNVKMFRAGAEHFSGQLFKWLWMEKNYYALKWTIRKELSFFYHAFVLMFKKQHDI